MKPDIKSIEERAEKATKGPWHCRNKVGIVFGPECQIAHFGAFDDPELVPFNADRWTADAQFAAHARTDIPALLTYIKELEGQVERRLVAQEAHYRLISKLQDERADLSAKYHDIGNTVLNVMEESENEGDRVYFGSTNDADMLRDLGRKYHEWRVDTALKGTQP